MEATRTGIRTRAGRRRWGDGVVVIAGDVPLAIELEAAAADAGWKCSPRRGPRADAPFLILDLLGGHEPDAPLQGGPQAIWCGPGSLTALDPAGGAVDFTPCRRCGRRTNRADARAGHRRGRGHAVERFFATLGKHTVWVGDAPGLVLGRIVCQVINECAFALARGSAAPRTSTPA